MAEDSLCPRVGTDDEHVRRTTLGHSNSRLPTVLMMNEPTHSSAGATARIRLRNPRRHNALVLGQRSMVDGEQFNWDKQPAYSRYTSHPPLR